MRGEGTPNNDTSRPYLVEILGIAGAGKSTLAELLSRGEPGYNRAEFIQTRNPIHLLHAAHSLPRLIPILSSNLIRKPRLSWADFKLMVYLTEWRRFLYRRPRYSKGITLLDQGPIYALVRLKAQNRGVASGCSFQRWWNEMAELWSATLSTVVWLDAPDEVLQARIDERVQSHALKGETVEIGQEYITRYRVLFDDMLRHLELTGDLNLLRFDTTDTPAGDIAASIRTALATRPASPS